MTFWETFFAMILAQIPLFFIQRYIFEKGIKKGLDKVEAHTLTFIRNKMQTKKEQ